VGCLLSLNWRYWIDGFIFQRTTISYSQGICSLT
jgi:hypothetical protein